jgi:hypothetical protein
VELKGLAGVCEIGLFVASLSARVGYDISNWRRVRDSW